MLTLIYLGFAIFGVGYVVVAGLLGHLVDAVDGDGHHGADGGDSFSFPFFSPLALATLFASIGGYGLAVKGGFGVEDRWSLLVALPLAVVTTYAVTWLGWKLMAGANASSQIRVGDLVDATGEVLTPIPAGSVGEVAAIVGGQRYTAPARAEDGGAIARGATVTVVKMLGSTLIVRPINH